MSWIDKFFSAYGTVAIAGSALPQRPTLNFVSGVTGVDNPSLNRTDLTVSGGGGGGGFTAITGVDVQAPTASTAYVGSISGFGAAGGTIPINATLLQFGAGQTSAGIGQATAGASQTPANLVLTPQGPNASAGTGFQTPGSLVVNLAAPVGTGSNAALTVQQAGTNYVQWGPITVSGTTYAGGWFKQSSPTNTNYNFLADQATGLFIQHPVTVGIGTDPAYGPNPSAAIYMNGGPSGGTTIFSQNAFGLNSPGASVIVQDATIQLRTLEASASPTLFQVGEFSTSRRFTALNQVVSPGGLSSSNIPTGDGITWVGVAQANPTSPPLGGFLLYSDQTTGAAFIWNPGTGSPFQIGTGGGGGGTVTGVDVAGVDNAHAYVLSISGTGGLGGPVAIGTPSHNVTLQIPNNANQVILESGAQSLLLADGSNNLQLNGLSTVQILAGGAPVGTFSATQFSPAAGLASFGLGWFSNTTTSATGASLFFQPQFSTNAGPTGGSVVYELEHSSTADAFVNLNYGATYNGSFATKLAMGLVPGSSGIAAGIWGPPGSSPTNANFAISMTSTSTAINGPTSGGEVDIAVNDVDVITVTSSAVSIGQLVGGLNVAFRWQLTAVTVTNLSSNLTLSSSQYSCPIIQFVSLSSPNAHSIIFPNVEAEWIIDLSGMAFGVGSMTFQAGSATKTVTVSHTSPLLMRLLCDGNGSMYSMTYS